MHPRVKRAIEQHARAIPHEEVCGFVYQGMDGVHAYPCVNVSTESRADTFEIAPADYAAVAELGRVCGLYHGGLTHTNEGFSEEDLEVARELGLPSYVYCGPSNTWARHVPATYRINPVGRPWAWGEADCYSTVEVHYRQELGIELPDYDRDESFMVETRSFIASQIAAAGFRRVEIPQEHDILLFSTPGHPYAHHLAICRNGNRILHHARGHLSCIEPLDGDWMRRLVGALRHHTL